MNFSHPESLNEAKASIEVLPCTFSSSLDECNKDVYFDPLVKRADLQFVLTGEKNDPTLKQAALQGRRLIGKEISLPPGYKGYVYGKHGETSQVQLSRLAEFKSITEWQKDEWSDDRGFVTNLTTYLGVASAIHNSD